MFFDIDEFLFGFEKFGFQVAPAFWCFGHVRTFRVVYSDVLFVKVLFVVLP